MPPTTRAPVNPDVLRWARELGGFEVEDFARRLQVKPERVAQWESGESQPTFRQLHDVAWLLRRPPTFFFLEEAPSPDLPQPPDFRSSRDPSQGSVQLRRELQAAVQRRSRYLRLVDQPSLFKLNIVMNELEEAAVTARAVGVTITEQVGIRDAYQAMHLWVSAIERLDVLVFQSTAFSLDEARGASIFFDALPIVLVNAKGFSCCSEFYVDT